MKKGVSAKKSLRRAKNDQIFFLVNGKQISTIKQLAQELDKISDEAFSHHVNQEKNDFANWIENVFGEKELADELRAEPNKKHVHYVILRAVTRDI